MRRTVFDSRIAAPIFRLIGFLWLKLSGWRVEGAVPDSKKFVMIAAPHTSNWDFPLMMAVAFRFRVKIYWMGKDSLFSGAAGPLVRWLGGVAIDRSKTNNVVSQMVDVFGQNDAFVLAIPPEGTRGKVREWKTGFYHIADAAKVPIVTGFLDYERKVGGVGPLFHTTGNLEKDMQGIQAFYRTVSGKYPEKTHFNTPTGE